MTKIANIAVSKLFVAFVAAAMLFTLATPAKAQTIEELQAQIAALMAQISALTDGGSSASAACTFTRPLTVGSQGADVECLQDYLTPTYFSFSGGSTGYFGPVTASAVAAWQSANGVSPAVGYFGPISQAKYSAVVDMDPSDSDDSDDDDASVGDLSGEAALTTFEVADGEEADEVEEGSEDVEVAEFNVEFSDGDAIITRLDIALDDGTVANTEADPWDVFEDVSLWVDGDEVARVDASDEDEYLDEDHGSLRFSNLNIVGMEDEEFTIVVKVSVVSSVDSADSATLADWDLYAAELRFVDADDVTTTETATGDLEDGDNATLTSGTEAEFTIETAGSGDELDLETSSEDPDATTFMLDDSNNTEEMIFAFDLSAEDSDGDVELNNNITLTATATVASSMDDLVNDFRLEIDGESFAAESYTGTGLTVTLVFDIDGDVVIEAGDTVTAMLYADFEDMEAADEGSTIVAEVEAADIDAEGEDDITVTGSTQVTGDTHTLRTEGASLSLVSTTETYKDNAADVTTDDEGVFTVKFEVTAFGEDIWVNKTAASGTASGTAGAKYLVEDSSGTQVGTPGNGTSTASLSSTAETDGTRFKVSEGETETFTLTVEFDPSSDGFYQVQLYALSFDTENDDPSTDEVATPSEDYETDPLSIEE